MAVNIPQASHANGTVRKPANPKAPLNQRAGGNGAASAPRRPTNSTGKPQPSRQSAKPVKDKAASVAGEMPATGASSAYAIMASRIANRVAEMAENITFVERAKPQEPPPTQEDIKRRPRKLEMRLQNSQADSIAFSAPFLDNTLQKMLQLQNRMLSSTAELSKGNGVGEQIIKEHAAQSAELSRIIALICAEKARQGA